MPAQRQAAPLLTITLVCYGQLIFTIVRERLPPSACRNLRPPAKIPQSLCSHLFTVPHHRFMSYTDVFLSDIEKHTEQACVLTSVSSMEVRMCKHLHRLQFSRDPWPTVVPPRLLCFPSAASVTLTAEKQEIAAHQLLGRPPGSPPAESTSRFSESISVRRRSR